MRCDNCGQEQIHFNLAAEYLKDGEWRTGMVCWECQKRLAPAIRARHAPRAGAIVTTTRQDAGLPSEART
jgi:hypothetical protein